MHGTRRIDEGAPRREKLARQIPEREQFPRLLKADRHQAGRRYAESSGYQARAAR